MYETEKVTSIHRQEQLIGEGIGFERIRRITGYLVGTLDRFNNAKRAEEHDRVKHDTCGCEFVKKADITEESRSA